MLVGAALAYGLYALATHAPPATAVPAVVPLPPPAVSASQVPSASPSPLPAARRVVRITANVAGDVWQGSEKLGPVPFDLAVAPKAPQTSYELRASDGRTKRFVIDESTGPSLELVIGPVERTRRSTPVGPRAKPAPLPAPTQSASGVSDEDRLLERLRRRVP
jgi:hypothetical protein